jgi:hypothetical protein
MTNVQRRALERAIADALMKSLQPALQAVVAQFRLELVEIFTRMIDHGETRSRRLGSAKHCAVCGLKNTRNHAALPPRHSQADHRRLKNGWPVATENVA